LCDTIVYGIRERLTDSLREHLTVSVRKAVSQSAMRGETAGGTQMAGLH
jgi:hypothetical protein